MAGCLDSADLSWVWGARGRVRTVQPSGHFSKLWWVPMGGTVEVGRGDGGPLVLDRISLSAFLVGSAA